MNRNNQGQRTFVYLRQLAGGRESGYARVETQDRAVKLHIALQGFVPQDEAHAFAVTDDGVLLLGRLLLDARGQGGLSALLSRKDMNRIEVLYVLRETPEGAQIPLAGTMGRTGQVNWEAVRRLSVQALHPGQEEKEAEETLEDPQVPQPSQRHEEMEETAAQTTAEEIPLEEERSLYDLAAQEEPYLAAERELRTPFVPEKRVELPKLLRNAYWPQQLWPLHDLFERFEEAFPFGEQEDCAYIRVPLDGKYGTVESYLVGAKMKDGWVTAVGYLIPGREDQPVGIAESWFADGYWQLWQYAQTE